MFGMSFPEIIVILVIAVIALGPDKLPQAIVEIAKYFKVLKKSINDAKSSFEQEIRIAELKEDAKKYKESFTKTQENVRKKLTFEELDELKNTVTSAKDTINENINDIKKDIDKINKTSKPISLNEEKTNPQTANNEKEKIENNKAAKKEEA